MPIKAALFLINLLALPGIVYATEFRFQVDYGDRVGTSVLIQGVESIELFGSPYGCSAVTKLVTDKEKSEKISKAGIICHPKWAKDPLEGDFDVDLLCKSNDKKDVELRVPSKGAKKMYSIKLSCN